jgi:glutaredoxin
MIIDLPANNNFTIYSKSGCPNCDNIKQLLINNNLIYNVINCDNYLNENKPFFLEFMKDLTKQECKTFPIIFKDKKYIGGYKEGLTEIYRISFDMEDNF